MIIEQSYKERLIPCYFPPDYPGDLSPAVLATPSIETGIPLTVHQIMLVLLIFLNCYIVFVFLSIQYAPIGHS